MPTTPLHDKTVVLYFTAVTATAAAVAAIAAYLYDPRRVTALTSSLLSTRCVPRQGSTRKKSRLYTIKERREHQQQQQQEQQQQQQQQQELV